jgi:hypothetical protein
MQEAPMEKQIALESNAEYEAFVDKFKPKLTTDDCYTPPEVYEVVKNWACAKYGIDPAKIVRPFYPGGDYKSFDYSNGAVVVDNPPFSKLVPICKFYLNEGVPFFLFAPELTLFSGRSIFTQINHIVSGCAVKYENGALVKTAFVTSFDAHIAAMTAPDLGRAIVAAQEEPSKSLPRYDYPDNILTGTMMQKMARNGISLEIYQKECAQVGRLDAQLAVKKSIYGAGLLLSAEAAEKAAAQKEAAEKAKKAKKAIKWSFSERELKLIEELGRKAKR